MIVSSFKCIFASFWMSPFTISRSKERRKRKENRVREKSIIAVVYISEK